MMTRLRWKRAVGLFMTIGVLIGCAVHPQRSATRTLAEVGNGGEHSVAMFFRSQVGTRWYGVYEDDIKIGWSKMVKTISAPLLSSRKFFQIQKRQEIELLINGYAHELAYQLDLWFETEPPYALERYTVFERVNDFVLQKEIVRDDQGYRRVLLRDGVQIPSAWQEINYTLEDELALERWIRDEPPVGDFIQLNCIDPESLQQAGGFAKILSIESQNTGDRSIRIYRIEHPEKGQGEYQSTYSDDSILALQQMNTGFELRHASETAARAPNPSEDLYVRFMLPIDSVIGRSDAVKRVKLAVDARTGALMTPATGQTIEKDPDQGGYQITLDATRTFRESATAQEIERNLKIDDALRGGDDSLVTAAREALNGIQDQREKVDRLLVFVDETVEDSNEVLSPGLKYLLDRRKGDCSEHAALFEALARYFGIPCRKVSGLVYMGDWAQSFGLHAWNEIILDGHWQPVDPIERRYDLPPFYIRFPIDRDARAKLSRSVPNMTFKVLEVDHFSTN